MEKIADEVTARELVLYADNSQSLYNQGNAIRKNLVKYMIKGTYSHERAIDGFIYLIEATIKEYRREFGLPAVNAATKRIAALSFVKELEHRAENDKYLIEETALKGAIVKTW